MKMIYRKFPKTASLPVTAAGSPDLGLALIRQSNRRAKFSTDEELVCRVERWERPSAGRCRRNSDFQLLSFLRRCWLPTRGPAHLSLNKEDWWMSVRTTSVNSGGEMGLIKYFAAPALSALVFHAPTVMAVSTTMGMPDVAGSCLSITVASTAFISGRSLLS